MDSLFYINMTVLVVAIYMVSRKKSAPRKFVIINLVVAFGYSFLFWGVTQNSGGNMGFLVDHYWILAMAAHWFLILIYALFSKQVGA